MQIPSIDGLVNPGEALIAGLGGLCAHRGVTRGMGLLVGALRGATVRPAPDATPVVLTAPTWLVQGTASIDDDVITVHGVISWVDQGLPRMVAGQIEAARSGGVRVQLLPTALAEEAVARPARSARAGRSANPAPKKDPADQLDLSETAAELKSQPAKPAASGWGAAVAASKRAAPVKEPVVTRSAASPAQTRPKTAGGGWGAAVAASTTRRRGGQPSPDELGFDAPPTLMAGDVLLHPRFGRCIVSRMVGKSKVKLRRPTGGLFDMHLKVCAFVREPDEGDKRVFSVTIRRP